MMPKFEILEFHPRYEEHQARAGRRVVTEPETEEAWYGERRIVRNKRTGKGPFLMLGRTDGGRNITVVLLTTKRQSVWCAYTAWDTP